MVLHKQWPQVLNGLPGVDVAQPMSTGTGRGWSRGGEKSTLGSRSIWTRIFADERG
jgi:hypothetical protein